MDVLTDPQVYASLATLTILEIVLGIDNLIFIAILATRLPPAQQHLARQTGIALALITRLGLLGSIAWIMSLVTPFFAIFGHPFSWRDLVLMGGGLFLLYKGTTEIHQRLEDGDNAESHSTGGTSFLSIVSQIVLLDIVFSLDSVVTAVGMAGEFWIMASAVVIAVVVMLFAAKPLSEFIEDHPTITMLALSFLLLIGMTLIADGAGFHVPKGYVYAAIGFSIGVEALNQLASRRRKRREPARDTLAPDKTDQQLVEPGQRHAS